MDCSELKGLIDSYISDELLVETNHEIIRHLDSCAGCSTQINETLSLQTRIRDAVISAEYTRIDPTFAKKTAESLRNTAMRPSFFERFRGAGFRPNARLAIVGFSAIFIMLLGGLFLLARLQGIESNALIFGTDNNKTLADAIQVSWNELSAKAVGDHENCAIEYNLEEAPITLDEAAKKFGAYNRDLDKVIMSAIGNEFSEETEFVEAHSCLYENHRFAHIVVRHKGKIVSFLITETDLPPDDGVVYTAFIDGSANATAFQIGHKAVFVVSGLSNAENLGIAKTVAPALREKFGA